MLLKKQLTEISLSIRANPSFNTENLEQKNVCLAHPWELFQNAWGRGVGRGVSTQKRSSSAHHPLITVKGSNCWTGPYINYPFQWSILQMRKLRFGEVMAHVTMTSRQQNFYMEPTSLDSQAGVTLRIPLMIMILKKQLLILICLSKLSIYIFWLCIKNSGIFSLPI